MVRGINRSSIFKDDQDKGRFLDRLSQNISEGRCFIYAWVLMENHIHLLAILQEAEHRQLRQLKVCPGGGTIAEIIGEESARAKISPQEVMSGSRRSVVSRTRAVVAYRSREEFGLSAAEIARHLGGGHIEHHKGN